MDNSVQFSKNIRFFRSHYGLNQAGFVKLLTEKDSRIQLHPSTISTWERGLTGQPTARILTWLARALNDFTPFTLTGRMLLTEDMETLFAHAKNEQSGISDTIVDLQKKCETMDKYLKHCLYRIQTLEEDRNRIYTVLNGFIEQGTAAGLKNILSTLGFEEHNGRFLDRSGTDVTGVIQQLKACLSGYDKP